NSATSDSGGGAIFTAFGVVTVKNSIVATSTGGNCAGSPFIGVTDGGFNISDDSTCGFTGTGDNGDTIGDGVSDSNIALDPLGLQDNFGPTKTIALETGSFAIDAAPCAGGVAT